MTDVKVSFFFFFLFVNGDTLLKDECIFSAFIFNVIEIHPRLSANSICLKLITVNTLSKI